MVLLPTYVEVDGVRYPGSFVPERVRAATRYLPGEDDLFLVTYPKCGTTWLHQIVYLILTGGKPSQDPKEFLARVPYIEMMGLEGFNNFLKPGAFKTHLPLDKIPYSKEAKYVYMSRNPKDTCVSFFEHTKSISSYRFPDGKFDDYFELFMEGLVNYNDYFQHVRSWYELKDQANVLFINFEDMKLDPLTTVRVIARFMDEHYDGVYNQQPQILEDIVRHSSFEAMKTTTNEVMRHMVPSGQPLRKPVDFVRRGTLGGWKHVMTEEQSNRIDRKVQEVLGDTDLPELWRLFHCV